MEEKMDTMLEKVEPNRRDFIKKVAIGAAYAVPVMASFNLDSVRNKAFAQASYVSPAGPGGPVPPEFQPPATTPGGAPDSRRIVFTQVMDTSRSAARMRNAFVCWDREVCVVSPNGAGDRGAAGCVTIDPSQTHWEWDGNNAQILTISGISTECVEGTRVIIRFGKLQNGTCTQFKGINGLDLVPFEDDKWFPCGDTVED